MCEEMTVTEKAVAFCIFSAGILMLSAVPGMLGIRQVQKAQAFNAIADGHRKIALAKTYDAKAAAANVKLVMKEVL